MASFLMCYFLALSLTDAFTYPNLSQAVRKNLIYILHFPRMLYYVQINWSEMLMKIFM